MVESQSRRRLLASGAAGAIALTAGCIGGGDDDDEVSTDYRIATAEEGSIGYTAATAVVSILEDTDLGISLRAEPGVGSVEGLRRVGSADLPLQVTTTQATFTGAQSIDYLEDFESDPVDYKPQHVFAFAEVNQSIGSWAGVGASSLTVDEVDGLSYTRGPTDVGRLWSNPLAAILDVGIDELDTVVDLPTSAYTDIPTGVRDGRFDLFPAYYVSRIAAPGWLQELVSDSDMRVVDFPSDGPSNLDGTPFGYVEVPVDAIFDHDPGVDPIPTATDTVVVSGSRAVSEDAIYEMVKASMEDSETIIDAHAGFHLLEPEWMVEKFLAASDVPVHPGTARYLQEEGYWDDDLTEGEVDDSPQYGIE